MSIKKLSISFLSVLVVLLNVLACAKEEEQVMALETHEHSPIPEPYVRGTTKSEVNCIVVSDSFKGNIELLKLTELSRGELVLPFDVNHAEVFGFEKRLMENYTNLINK